MENKHTNYHVVAVGIIFTNVYVEIYNTTFITFMRRNAGRHLFLSLCKFTP